MTFSKIFKKIHCVFNLCADGKNESCQVHFFEKVNDIPSGYTEMLKKRPNVFLQPHYLKAIEESKPADMQFAYACIEQKGVPVAFMYFQLLRIRIDQADEFLNPRYFGKELESIKNGSGNIFLKKYLSTPIYIMFCGNVFLSGEHGIHIEEAYKTSELIASFPGMMQEVIDRLGENVKIGGVVIKDFYDKTFQDIPVLEKDGYKKFYFEPNMVMDIRRSWKTFDDYLDELSSKYRVRAKNVFKKAENIEIREFGEKEILLNGDIINTLYNNVHQKAAVHFSSVNVSYFAKLKHHLKDGFLFKAFFLDKKMIAFSTYVFGPQGCEAHLVGLDYDYNKPHSLYLLILYTYLKDAIARQVPLISFGRTALEIKSTVGAKAMPMYCYLGLQSPLSINMISPFISLSGVKETIERDPFKEGNEVELSLKNGS